MQPRIIIDFTTKRTWHNSYVRTRHKNLRCFPCCSPYHKESSFCGVSVIIEVKGISNPKDWTVLGALRKLQDEPYISPGQKLPDLIPETHQSNQLIPANETKVDTNHQQETVVTYEFVPPRRWKYNCRLAKHTSSQKHTFSIYLCKTDSRECIKVINSPTFQIKSAWRQTSETVSRPRIKETPTERPPIKSEREKHTAIVTSSGHANPTLKSPNQIMVQQQTNVLWPLPNQLHVQSDALLIQQNNALIYNLMAQNQQQNPQQRNIRRYSQAFGNTTPLYPLQSTTTSSLNLLIAPQTSAGLNIPQANADTLGRPSKRQMLQEDVKLSQPMIPINSVQFCQNIQVPSTSLMVSKPLSLDICNPTTIFTASTIPIEATKQVQNFAHSLKR